MFNKKNTLFLDSIKTDYQNLDDDRPHSTKQIDLFDSNIEDAPFKSKSLTCKIMLSDIKNHVKYIKKTSKDISDASISKLEEILEECDPQENEKLKIVTKRLKTSTQISKLNFNEIEKLSFMSENTIETQKLNMITKKRLSNKLNKKNKDKVENEENNSFISEHSGDDEVAEKIILTNREINVKKKTFKKLNFVLKKTSSYISNIYLIKGFTSQNVTEVLIDQDNLDQKIQKYESHKYLKYNNPLNENDSILNLIDSEEKENKTFYEQESEDLIDDSKQNSPQKKLKFDEKFIYNETIKVNKTKFNIQTNDIDSICCNSSFNDTDNITKENKSDKSKKSKTRKSSENSIKLIKYDKDFDISKDKNFALVNEKENSKTDIEIEQDKTKDLSNNLLLENLINQYYYDIKDNYIGNYEEYVVNNLTIISFLENLIKTKFQTPPSLSIEDQEKVKLFDKSKKVLYLDLDETLIHSDLEKQFEYSDAEISVDFEDGSKSKFSIIVRPYTYEFLQFASERFNLVLFTAGIKQYADPIVDYLDPNKEYFKLRLYRCSCTQYNNFFFKDLNIIEKYSDYYYNSTNTVILDNCIYSFGMNLKNGILISSFYFDFNDKELLNVADYLEDKLMYSNDIKEVSENFFGLETIKKFMYERLIKEGIINN